MNLQGETFCLVPLGERHWVPLSAQRSHLRQTRGIVTGVTESQYLSAGGSARRSYLQHKSAATSRRVCPRYQHSSDTTGKSKTPLLAEMSRSREFIKEGDKYRLVVVIVFTENGDDEHLPPRLQRYSDAEGDGLSQGRACSRWTPGSDTYSGTSSSPSKQEHTDHGVAWLEQKTRSPSREGNPDGATAVRRDDPRYLTERVLSSAFEEIAVTI